MPGFVRTKKDEAKWKKAKKSAAASKQKEEETFSDRDWALVNHIYHQMNKSIGGLADDNLEDVIESLKNTKELIKQRGRSYGGEDEMISALEDEPESDESSYDEPQGYEFDQPETESAESDPYDLEETGSESQPELPQLQGRFNLKDIPEPTFEQINALRSYTRPWEQRARDLIKLKADPKKNPLLAREGHIIEARNLAHKDRHAAYSEMTSSDAYKNADPITQMTMDEEFERNWQKNNPDHTAAAINAHMDAHSKGSKAKELFQANKEATIQNILQGGASPEEAFSVEEGLQHAGGTKGEEGTVGTVKSDPFAHFAIGNQEFIRDYAKNFNKKAKTVSSIDDMGSFSEESKRDIQRILGAPIKSPTFDSFFNTYSPLIAVNARRAINAMGLEPNHENVDMGLLHEAGMHGLVQAINSFDPNKGASFKTHASNTIRGLQMTALKSMDQIPREVRSALKEFNKRRKSSSVETTAPAEIKPTPAAVPVQAQIAPPAAAAPAPVPLTPEEKIKQMTPHPNVDAIKDRQARIIVRKKGPR